MSTQYMEIFLRKVTIGLFRHSYFKNVSLVHVGLFIFLWYNIVQGGGDVAARAQRKL